MIDKNPIFTFLDTSAIDPMYNSLNPTHIEILKKNINQGKIALTTSPIVIKEVYSHLKKEIPQKNENLKGVLESREFALLRNTEKYSILTKSFSTDEMVEDSFKEFKKLLNDLQVKILQDNRISISRLLDMYFKSEPPFGEKNKKSEFPDAIMYLTLQKYLDEGVKIHVIASDNDWQAIQENNSCFIVHKSIKEYIDYLNQDDKFYNLVRTYLNSSEAKDEITRYFMEYVNSLDFTVDGHENSIHGMKAGYDYEYVEKIGAYSYDYNIDIFEDISLVKDKYVAQVVIMCYSEVDMKCIYFDEENSIWDSENHEYIEKEYGELVETHELLVPIRILIECSNDKTFNITNYNIIESDYDISELNNLTRLKRQNYQYFEKDKFRVLRNLKCPYCNNNIHIDLISGETSVVCSNERNMGIENEYDVDIIEDCKNCGNTFHVTGKVWEYPEKAFNYENDIKISKFEE